MWKVTAAAFVLAFAVAGLAAVVVGGTSPPTGAQLFAARCSGCHTLGPRHVQSNGGDLSRLKLTLRQAESFTRVMPARPPLTDAEIRAVSAYVYAARLSAPR